MESSGSGAADCSVGSIVWVRRRNGSWWPGKILGPEELSASHLMSPRSGTPVKLLGREDASVDWYNLEKSKRVKAFRCGEFDDCIERAESSQGMPIKKREKYARREDAILHALELEKQLLNKQGKSGATSDRMCSKSPGALKKAPVTTSSGSLGNDKGKFGNPRSHQLSKNIDTVSKGEIVASPLFLQKVKEENQLSWEDDNSEATPRMRGLQDFGLRIAPSKRKLVSSVALNGSERPAIDNTSQAPSTHGLIMETTSHGNGKNSLHKRKRSHEGLAVDILVKRRDRRRPIVQVLQNSAKLEVSHSLLPDCGTVSTSISGVEQVGSVSRAKRSKCVYLPTESSDSLEYKAIPASHIDMPSSQFGEGSCHPRLGSFLEENQSGFINDAGSDSSDTDSSNSDSDDSSETEPDMDEEEMAALSDPYAHGRPEVLGDYGNLSSEELDELAHSGDTSHRYSEDPVPANEAVSKWKSKGKRNVRNLSRRTTGPSLRQNLSLLRNDDFDYGTEDADWNEKDGWGQMAPLGSGGYPLSSRYSSKNHNRNMTVWEDSAWEDQTTLGRYWENKRDYFDPVYVGRHHVGGRARSYLVDVDLKVQASYQKEPVPIVSLMSKLNGKAIIGHPIQIETLEDGLTETLLSTVSDFGNEALDDGNTAIPPAWRTARRTANFRIPRPHLSSSALDGDEATKDLDLPSSDQEKKLPLKKGSSSSKSRKNVPHTRRPPTDRKLQNKLPKSSLSSSQKTRTLSSFAMEHKYSSKPIHDSSSVPVPVPTTTVACIPVKLVFSRLLEKINRPPSKTVSSNVVVSNSDT